MHNRHLLSNALGRRRFADELVDYLIGLGVEYLFGMPAESVNSFVHAASRRSEIQVVNARHESAAALMAVGYARATGRLGVCFGTAGPGATNLLAGTYEAFLGRVPLLAISGQVPVAGIGRDSFQEIDSAALFAPCTSSSVQVHAASQFERIARSCMVAVHESTACHVAIPGDVLYGPIGPHDKSLRAPSPPAPGIASKEELSAIAEFLDSDDLALVTFSDAYCRPAQALSAQLGCRAYCARDAGVIPARNLLIVGRSSPLITQCVHPHANLLELTDRRFTSRSMPYIRRIICDVDATLRAVLGADPADASGAADPRLWRVYSDLDDTVLPQAISLDTSVISSLANIPGAALPLGIGGALADRAASRSLVVTEYRQLNQFVAELSGLPDDADIIVICLTDNRETLSRIAHLGAAMSLRTATADSVGELSRVFADVAASRAPAIIAVSQDDSARTAAPRPGARSLAHHLTTGLAAPLQVSGFCTSRLGSFGAAQCSVNAQAPSMSASALRKMGARSAGTVAATESALLLQLNGIYDAALDDAKILVTTIEARPWLLDTHRILEGVTSVRYTVDDPTTAAATVRRACAAAAAPGGGIVHLQVLARAFDVEWADGESTAVSSWPNTLRPSAAAPDQSAIARAVAMLRDAERVAIVAGRGAAGCSYQLAELARLLSTRVHLTMGGDSVLVDSKLRAHSRIGGSGDLRAAREVARADVLLLVGVSNRGSAFDLGASGRTIALNLDPNAMLRLGEDDICVLADAMSGLEAMVGALRADPPPRIPRARLTSRVTRIKGWRTDAKPLRASRLVRAIEQELQKYDGTSTVCADVGVNTLWVYRYITSMTRGLWSASFGTMGFAIPAAIAVARNSAEQTLTVAVAGDGGTALALSQIQSSARIAAPVVFVVVNNSALAAIKFESEIMGWPDRGSTLPEIDFAQYAASIGVRSRRVDTLRDFRAAFKEAIGAPRPYLIDARCMLNDAPVLAGKNNWRQVIGFFVAWSQEGRAGVGSFGEVLRAVVHAKIERLVAR